MYMLYQLIVSTNKSEHTLSKIFTHSNILEITWTIIPSIILFLLAVPSFGLLYSLDELMNSPLTIKVIGHQWWWEYQLDRAFLTPNTIIYTKSSLESRLTDVADLTIGTHRLLEVDNRLVLPANTHIKALITSADVLHSWAVPSLGIKIDACPGRITEGNFLIKRFGTFYGQCSEICGSNHGFMPIVIESVSEKVWYDYNLTLLTARYTFN